VRPGGEFITIGIALDHVTHFSFWFVSSAYYRDGTTCVAFDARGKGMVMRPGGAVALRHDPAKGGARFDAEGRQIDSWSAPRVKHFAFTRYSFTSIRLCTNQPSFHSSYPLRHDPAKRGARFDAEGRQIDSWSAPRVKHFAITRYSFTSSRLCGFTP